MKDLTDDYISALGKQDVIYHREKSTPLDTVSQLFRESNKLSVRFIAIFNEGKKAFKILDNLIKSASTVDSKQNSIDMACHELQTTIHHLNEKLQFIKTISLNICQRNQSSEPIMKAIQEILSVKVYNLSQNSKEIFQRSTKKIRDIAARIQELDYSSNTVEADEGTTLQVSVEKKDYSTEQIEKVMKSLIEVSEMFQTMSEMVALQQSLIERIDQDTDEALDNVKKGEAQLKISYEQEINTRALMLKLFAIIFVFSLFYILFIA